MTKAGKEPAEGSVRARSKPHSGAASDGCPVLLVGLREGALAAAERMGLRVYLLADRRIPLSVRRRVTGHCAVPANMSSDAVWATLRQQCPELFTFSGRPAAVLATVEASVELAAALRARFRLPGVEPKTAHWCKNKTAMKRRARWLGIPCADFARVSERTSAASLVLRLGLPVVLKPVDSSGSRGTAVCNTFTDVAKKLQPGYLAEAYVHGLEMSVETLVVDGEIRFVNLSEYLLPLWANIVPASLPAAAEAQVLELNRRVIEGFGIRQGITHLEIYLTPGGPVFGELAVRPPGGYLMDLISHAYGFDAWEAVLQCELGTLQPLPLQAERFCGVWLLHAGAGEVTRVSGVQSAERVRWVDSVRCRVQPGDVVARRAGSGESQGLVLASAPSRDEVVTALQLARRSILIETRRLSNRRRPRRPRAA